MNKAIVYIEEMNSVADVTFPAVPQVVSLLLYDDTTRAKDNPHPPTGYPVVCVTVRDTNNLVNYLQLIVCSISNCLVYVHVSSGLQPQIL